MQNKFLIRCIAFFIPVIAGYLLVEWLTVNLDSGYKNIGTQLEKNKEKIEVMVLGSSQMKDAVNPEWISAPTLNLASGDQHHNTDFKLLKGLINELPNLQTVVIEVSYSHFELPHNPTDFWKNSIYLKYYGVNAFERPAWFKDQLIYLANHTYYSRKISEQYLRKEQLEGFNAYGFDTLNYSGIFQNLEYDEEKIAAEKKFKINTRPAKEIFKKNSTLFFEFVDYINEKNLQIILCHPPMYKTYLPMRNPEILKRRDSIVASARDRYPEMMWLDLEADTLGFSVKDFWNQSHLNPRGAEKFSRLLNEVIQDPDFKFEK